MIYGYGLQTLFPKPETTCNTTLTSHVFAQIHNMARVNPIRYGRPPQPLPGFKASAPDVILGLGWERNVLSWLVRGSSLGKNAWELYPQMEKRLRNVVSPGA